MRLLSGLALLLAFASYALARDPLPEPNPPRGTARHALFKWIDGLGFAFADAPFVHIAWHGRPELGFLVAEEGDGAKLLTLGLETYDTKPRSDGPNPVTFERIDADAAVQEFLAETRAARKEGMGLHVGGSEASHRARLVLLARRLAATGPAELVEELLSEASILPGYRDWHGTDTSKSLQERVSDDLEHAFHVRAFSWPKPDDLPAWHDAYTAFARRFPESVHALDAWRLARVVERMAGDAASVPTEADLAKLEGEALARGLVLRLRTIDTLLDSAMGGPASIFASHSGLPPTPADRLVALGDSAIPALLEHLDDDTLTPLAYEGRNFGNPGVLTVGSCAFLVLGEIVKEPFATPAHAMTWWIRKHRDGEVAALIGRTMRGGTDALAAARELSARAPLDAAWVVQAGWKSQPEDIENVAAPNAWVDVYATIQAPRVADVLEAESRHGYRLTHRVAAAIALTRLDASRGVQSARSLALHLREESHATPDGPPGNGGRRDLNALCAAENVAAERLIRFVVERNGIDVLSARYARQWPHVRVMIARNVASFASMLLETLDGARPNAPERLLLTVLDDTEVVPYVAAAASGTATTNVRPCDAAVDALSARFKVPLGADRSLAQRDADVAAWRKRLTESMPPPK